MAEPFVSIVIPAYNCESTIQRVLASALSQDCPQNYEVIVVDDGSTDATPEMIKSFGAVKYIRQQNSGPASARNRGFKESKGEIVFFTDADCLSERNWVQTAVKHFENPQIGVVAGSYGIANEENLLARCIHKEIFFRHRRRMPDYPQSFGSYNFCVRRNIFDRVGGFDEDYRYASGEDNDLSYKVLKSGYRIYFERSAIVKHYHPENLIKYLREQFRHGFWRVKMYKNHPDRVLGDDYTFWKDILEPAIILGIIAALILTLGGCEWGKMILTPLALLLIFLEFFYGLIITNHIFESLFFGFVMLVRSFARTLGFCFGLPFFCLQNTSKKFK